LGIQRLGTAIERKQQYDEEKHLFIIHPSEWRYIDRHLRLVVLIYLRGWDHGNYRFTWKQVECQTGQSQKTLSGVLKEAKVEFPNWWDINKRIDILSHDAIRRRNFREKKNLSSRHSEWAKRGKLERLQFGFFNHLLIS